MCRASVTWGNEERSGETWPKLPGESHGKARGSVHACDKVEYTALTAEPLPEDQLDGPPSTIPGSPASSSMCQLYFTRAQDPNHLELGLLTLIADKSVPPKTWLRRCDGPKVSFDVTRTRNIKGLLEIS